MLPFLCNFVHNLKFIWWFPWLWRRVASYVNIGLLDVPTQKPQFQIWTAWRIQNPCKCVYLCFHLTNFDISSHSTTRFSLNLMPYYIMLFLERSAMVLCRHLLFDVTEITILMTSSSYSILSSLGHLSSIELLNPISDQQEALAVYMLQSSSIQEWLMVN